MQVALHVSLGKCIALSIAAIFKCRSVFLFFVILLIQVKFVIVIVVRIVTEKT